MQNGGSLQVFAPVSVDGLSFHKLDKWLQLLWRYSARKILFTSGKLLPVNGTFIAVISTWRRNSHLWPRQHYCLAFMTSFCYCLLLSSGDIEVNPGPTKFPCGICRRLVRGSQAGVQCDLYDYWVQKRCINMPNYEYEHLQLSDKPCCSPCLKNKHSRSTTVSAHYHLIMVTLTRLFPPTFVSFLIF